MAVVESLDSAKAVFLYASCDVFVLKSLLRFLMDKAESFLFGNENFFQGQAFAVRTNQLRGVDLHLNNYIINFTG